MAQQQAALERRRRRYNKCIIISGVGRWIRLDLASHRKRDAARPPAPATSGIISPYYRLMSILCKRAILCTRSLADGNKIEAKRDDAPNALARLSAGS